MNSSMRRTFLAILLAIGVCAHAAAWRIEYTADPATRAISAMTIGGDDSHMDWLLKTDGTQYPWVGDAYQWGRGYMTVDGTPCRWTPDGKGSPTVTVTVERRRDGDDLLERYTFTNVSGQTVTITGVGIFTPFNDNYPDAMTCMTGRCNAHLWPGGTAAYVKAMRMNGVAPHVGLMVTEGEIADYDVWERGSGKGMSNFRGVLALCPPDMTLKPGRSYHVAWRVFTHGGSDFDSQMQARGGMTVRSDKYVYGVGEQAKVEFITKGRVKTITHRIASPGETRVTYKGTYAQLLGITGEEELLRKRVRFILHNQQMNDSRDPRYGAFMIYDNEGDSILTDGRGRSDLDEGRERVGMGILLAEYCRRHPAPQMREALVRYASFIRGKLQEEDYRTGSRATGKSKDRGYNYAWVADFYFRMYSLTGNRQYALDGYGTLQALYRRFGHGFYCIDYPVSTGLEALRQAGLHAERARLLQDFRQTADIFVRNGLNFPKFEVNYEQSIIAPAVWFLCEVYLATGSGAYLDAARGMLPALEALSGDQPSHRMNGIGIRHWDGYWFGKRQTYGDVFPHYWSAITAAAYHHYAKATGDARYQRRAENIVRGNLSLFSEDGRATCAFVNPRMVNGMPAHYADAYANDQDWALMFYLMVTE